LQQAYRTSFRTIDPHWWTLDTSCRHCAPRRDGSPGTECTRNQPRNAQPASIAGGAGLTIVATRLLGSAALARSCTPTAGGTSAFLSSARRLHFGRVSVLAQFFPQIHGVATAKGCIGLEDRHSGAITITVHGTR
jgi:hypothetical protein